MPVPLQIGTHIKRPAAAASNAGFLYFEENTNGGTLYQSDGANWNPAGVQAGTYTPTLLGATDNPVPTFSTQIGRYYQLGKLCFVSIVLVSTTMTKTTTTDKVWVSLPFAAANVAGAVNVLQARLENATPVVNATIAETTANAAYLQLRDVPDSASSVVLTYDASAGIGVLTDTITIQISGVYETV